MSNEDTTATAVQSFCCTHKPRMPKERDVTVFYYPFKNGLPLNSAASTLFKMQIFGDVLLANATPGTLDVTPPASPGNSTHRAYHGGAAEVMASLGDHHGYHGP